MVLKPWEYVSPTRVCSARRGAEDSNIKQSEEDEELIRENDKEQTER